MRKMKRYAAFMLVTAMVTGCLVGCGEKTSGTESVDTQIQTEENVGSATEVVDLEVWGTNNGFLEVKKDGAIYNLYKEMMGVGIIQPYIEWNGGSTYQEQLNLRIAAGEMPDMFKPVNGMELELAKNGALLDLTDLLPEKAPHLWEAIPQEVWDVMRSYDPTGEGRIYMIPSITDYPLMGAMIRQDWLDKLNLQIPSTQEEFVETLRAFKEQDPNGNGQLDEIPAGGRQEAKWMDYLFAMYDVAMWEGNPEWDIYEGELTYSGVTKNMRDALAFVAELYQEGLLDPETLLNDKAGWEGKIKSDRVGVYYHWAQTCHEMAIDIFKSTGNQPEWVVIPPISAPGYEGAYTERKVKNVEWVLKNTDDPAKIDAYMKVLDAYGNKELWNDFYFGAENMHYILENGKKVLLPEDKKTQEKRIFLPGQNIATVESIVDQLETANSAEQSWAFEQSIRNIQLMPEYGKAIAGDGIPSGIYDGYPDIMNRTLYVEYASKIITGEYPIEKFDEFVERWYESGGEQVTMAARAWYDKINQ